MMYVYKIGKATPHQTKRAIQIDACIFEFISLNYL